MKLSFKEPSTRSFMKFLFAPLIINFIIELCSRRNLNDTFGYIFGSPLVFLYNSLIILATLSIVLLFKRRTFFFTLITTVWIGFGITNGIILSNRVTPFTATDLTLAARIYRKKRLLKFSRNCSMLSKCAKRQDICIRRILNGFI